MFFSKRSSASNDSVNLVFANHNSDTGKLLIYNSGKNRLSKINIILFSTNKNEYKYDREVISTRSNEMIEFTVHPDLYGKVFEGELLKVTIETGGRIWSFKPTEDGKFVKI